MPVTGRSGYNLLIIFKMLGQFLFEIYAIIHVRIRFVCFKDREEMLEKMRENV